VCRRGSNCRQVLCRAGQRQASDHARSGKEKIQLDREVAELPEPRSSWRAPPISAIRDRDRFSQGPNLVLLLFLDVAQLLRCGEGVRYFLKSPQRTLRILKLGLIEDGLGGPTLLWLIAVPHHANCQSATAAVNGTVRDQSGAVISEVQIIVTNTIFPARK